MSGIGEIESISLLAQLLRQGERRVVAGSFSPRDATSIAALVRAGALVPDGVVETVVCDVCETPHLATIVRGGSKGAYGWYCPEAGFTTASLESIAALSVSSNRILVLLGDALTAAFGQRRWRTRPLQDNAWLLGVWNIDGASTTVVMAGSTESVSSMHSLSQVLESLPPNDAQLILSIDDDAAFGVESPRRVIVPLVASALVTSEGLFTVVSSVLARAVADAVNFRFRHVGRPSVELGVRRVIEALLAEGQLRETIVPSVVAAAWDRVHHGEKPPSPATLRLHIRRWQNAGS